MGDLDRGADDDGAALVGGHRHDERPVDLEHVDGQPDQPGHGRVAHPEVVEGDRDPVRGELLHRLLGRGPQRGERPLGDLQPQQPRWKPRVPQQPLDVVRQVGVVEALGGEVDRHRDGEAGPLPAPRLPDGHAQHVTVEHPDQPAVLHRRDELVGRDDPAPRVVPAHERLDGDHPAGLEFHLGLVVEDQTVLPHRPLQAPDQAVGGHVHGWPIPLAARHRRFSIPVEQRG